MTTVMATFARPFPAILTGLVIFVGMRHFAKGATMMIEDYARGSARKVADHSGDLAFLRDHRGGHLRPCPHGTLKD